MVKTIGNPLSWTAQRLVGAGEHVTESVEAIGGTDAADLSIQHLTNEDLRTALRKGLEDFSVSRADVMFICLIYPIIGLVLAGLALNMNLLPLLFPVAAGFALLGPLAAVGLYEVSRRREMGEDVTWLAALNVVRDPNFSALVVMGLYLIGIFLVWLLVANLIYTLTLGPEPPASIATFMTDVLTTGAGWAMIIIGVAVGFIFALAVLAISVVSFPLLLDKHVGVPTAIMTSIGVFRENPRVIASWGVIVAASLFVGSLPAFVGLVLVLPILGHATWHLYRLAVKTA